MAKAEHSLEEILKESIAAGIITEEQADLMRAHSIEQLTPRQKAIINIIHGLYCPLSHDVKDAAKACCTYYEEEPRTEIWDLPAHIQWKRVYLKMVEELTPVDDREFIAHIQEANELLGKLHKTVCWLISYDCTGLPTAFFEDPNAKVMEEVDGESRPASSN